MNGRSWKDILDIWDKGFILKYPKNITRDLNILKKVRVDFVFTPSTKEIYKKPWLTFCLAV